ncbi:MAG: NifB/NifX family molybdenum-iron cluster-binding protein [candidate division Zixibacteria bacterium]|nr:NifB/NifX family molybdenum-iron cluster-binding protein [candidate division Zixibacteria bacterium]
MIIAISSKGSDLDSLVDERFGRANYFIIYDTDTDRFEALDNNANAKSSQGVGVKAVELLSGKNIDLVISENFGPQAFSALATADIKSALWSKGKVSEAIELARNDKLEFCTQANVGGHW